MNNIPSGTVTFLFTDIEGSTQLWEQYPEAMKPALARHDAILREAIESDHGHLIKTTGDGVHAVFSTAIDAARASLSAQRDLQSPTPDPSSPQIKVRMGLHTGEAEARAGDYFGPVLNRAARLMSIAYGGQIVLSGAAADILRDQLADGMTLLDLGEHRLKDLARPERVFQLNQPGLPAEFPPLRSLDSFPNNLPVQLTRFIGREREIAEAKERFSTERLLTLIGPGGTGKTRLALQIGADLLPTFVDGVWLADLASITDPARVSPTIASIFGLRDLLGVGLLDQLIDYLRAKHLLLILDNCEHLVETCAQLAEQLLQACPQLEVIASSREALGISGETVYRVPSLSLPAPTQATTQTLLECEAAQLFVERAAAAQSHFALTDRNATSIAQICQRLDGIPLALELAAARVSVFSPEQIAARLDDRFKLLTGGSRTALPRQQTLRALIDWSYDLLIEPERDLFQRLSVFAGGWTFEAAESVCRDLDVLDLLPQLINKSLVAVDESEGEARYRLLETVRQYARDKLFESGRVADVRQHHLDYFVGLAEEGQTEFFGPGMLIWLKRGNAETDNLRAALEWALESQPETALRLASPLANLLSLRSQMSEARTWCQAALSRAEALPPVEGEAARARASARADVLSAMAWAAITQGDHRAGLAAAQESASLAREFGDTRRLAQVLQTLSLAATFLGELPLADSSAKESEAISRQMGYNAELAMTLTALAQNTFVRGGDPVRAQVYMNEAVALAQASGSPWVTSYLEMIRGMQAFQRGDVAQGRESAARLTAYYAELGDRRMFHSVRSEQAHGLRRYGELDEALGIYRETILGWQELGHRAAVAHQLECIASILAQRGEGGRAAMLLGAAEVLREACGSPMTLTERPEYDQAVADLRTQLDGSALDSAWAGGRKMTMDEAIHVALEADSVAP